VNFCAGNVQINTRFVRLLRFLLKDVMLLTQLLLSFGSLGKGIRIFLQPQFALTFYKSVCFSSSSFYFLPSPVSLTSFLALFSSIFNLFLICFACKNILSSVVLLHSDPLPTTVNTAAVIDLFCIHSTSYTYINNEACIWALSHKWDLYSYK
jgi:hypothetical protein